MSEENVEIVRRCIEAWNRGDIEALLGFSDPRHRVVESAGRSPERGLPRA